MKYRKTLTVSLALVWILVGGAMAGQDSMTGKCVKVIDGDTLVIECEKSRRTVEIDGIDAPELEQPWGKMVRTFVKDMVRGREVEIEIVESDADVVRARVWVDGADLSEILAGRGLAWVPEDSDDTELLQLSAKAKGHPCGLWMDPDPVAPWDFREAQS